MVTDEKREESGAAKGGSVRDMSQTGKNAWDVNWSKHKELTRSWIGRCVRAMIAELGQNIGERTQHAIKPRIEELHSMGLKSDQAGKILAYEYRQHSALSKEKERVSRERDFVVRERDEALAQLRALETGGRPLASPAPPPRQAAQASNAAGYTIRKGVKNLPMADEIDSFGVDEHRR